MCEKWKQKTAGKRATEVQARAYFKDAYEIYDTEPDSLNKIGVANNVVMQQKMDKLTTKNMEMKLDMAANQAKNEKYHHIINIAMSTTQVIEETDDTTLDTQWWSAYTASHEKDMATIRKRLEECMRTNFNTPPPAVINTASKNTDHKQHRGPLSDGPEGVTKIMKYYKNCDNAC